MINSPCAMSTNSGSPTTTPTPSDVNVLSLVRTLVTCRLPESPVKCSVCVPASSMMLLLSEMAVSLLITSAASIKSLANVQLLMDTGALASPNRSSCSIGSRRIGSW